MEEKNLTLKGSQLLKDVFQFFSIFHTKQNNFIVVYFFLVHNNVFNSQISKTLVCIGQNEERKKVLIFAQSLP